jgi:adenylate cyclase
MAENADRRKLAAILCADVKGYSKLMGEDESYTVGALKERRELFAENIQNHGGRVVNAPGDSILAEFPSVVSAVQCAVEIQTHIDDRNTKLPDNRKMVFRIGVNLGDVIESEDAIYGDGVNIAARIEALADPGGVSISRTVFDHVQKKLPYGYEYQGEHQVKNITNPVKVYKLLTAPEDAGKMVGMEPPVSASKWIWPTVVVAAIVVTLIGYQVYQEIAGPKFEPASVEKMAYTLPDKPSIAVLPFDNMSDDPQQDYFSDGITEDLITDLSKISSIFVIARNSTFTYKDRPVKIKKVAEDLGVRYVIEGSVRRAGDKIRINVQLIDATTGYHLWAERYDSKLESIFDIQDKINKKIISALAVKLTQGEQELFARKYTDNIEAYDAFLEGMKYLYLMNSESLGEAVSFFKRAVEIDPNYARAHGMLASSYNISLITRWFIDLGWSNVRALRDKHLQEALKDPTSYPAHRTFSYILIYRNKHEEAVSEAERVLSLAPGDADSHFTMGRALIWAGRSVDAIDYLKNAIRLNPDSPAYYLWHLGLAQFLIGQMEEALFLAERSRQRGYFMSTWLEAITNAQLGNGNKAAKILADYFDKRKWPIVPIENSFNAWPFGNEKDRDFFVESLKKAGVPRPWNPVYRREYDKAISDADHAIKRNPNDAEAQLLMGESLIFVGKSSEAEGFIEKAISLNPKYSSVYLYILGLSQFCLQKYEEAAASLEAYDVQRKKEHLVGVPSWLLASTYAHLGKEMEAEDLIANYMKSRGYKRFTVKDVLKYNLHAFKDPRDTERFAQGLRKAGMPMD